MDTPGSVEVLVYLLGKDQLYDEHLSNQIVQMLCVMVFEAEDLIGVEEMVRDDDESYRPDLKAAVPRRVLDAFRTMQTRCNENVAFEGFTSALRHAKDLSTSLNYLQLLIQILNASPSLQSRMIIWGTLLLYVVCHLSLFLSLALPPPNVFLHTPTYPHTQIGTLKRVDLIGACYHVTKKWRTKLRGDGNSKEEDYNTELDFMHVSKEKPLSNVDRAKFEGILTDFDMAFNEELLYQRNEDMQSQSSQFKSAGIEQLLQEFKSAVTPNVRKNVEMMIRSLTLTLTQTGDTPFGTKLTKALAAQTEKAVSCVYGGNVDMLKMDEKERKRLLEQYNTDMEDKKYKEKALKRQFEEANEKVEKTQKRLGEIEEKLANKIAENIRLTEENDTLQGSKQEMSKSLTSMKSMYDNDLASREKLQTRCDDLNREKTNLENKITELETRLAHKRKPTSPDISSSSSEKVSELEIQLEAKVKAVTKITKELSESRSMIQSLKDSLSARDDELKKLRENPPTLMTSTSSTTGPPEIPTKQSQDGEETKEEKTSDDSDVPEGFKPEFCPMIVALTTSKHLKKWKALSSLSKGKPLGVKPEDVPVEIAEEFVNTFIPSVRGVTLSLSLTISHTHIHIRYVQCSNRKVRKESVS